MTTFNLSEISIQRLSTCHPFLVHLVTEVSKTFPLIVLCGYRDHKEQDEAVASGNSKTPWPTSKHNKSPSQAVDISPFPYNPSDTAKIYLMSGFVLGVASKLKIPIRWGGNWSGDFQFEDKFKDLFHFEIGAH